MSNYLLIFGSPARISEIVKRICPSSDEQIVWKLRHDLQALYVSRDPTRDVQAVLDIFRGFCIDNKNRRIIFSGQDRQRENPIPEDFHEGAYLRCTRQDDIVKIGNDAFSQLLLLYFSETGIIAISDSLYILSEVRKAAGLAVEINIHAMIARAWTNAMASQLLSTNTPIEGIKFAPPGTLFTIDTSKDVNSIELRIETKPAKANFRQLSSDYYDELVAGVRRSAAIIYGLSSIEGVETTLDLSGGLDSRSVFATAIKSILRSNKISVRSNKLREQDYSIAKLLADSYGIELGLSISDSEGPDDRTDPIAGWVVSCLGTYDASYPPGATYNNKVRFRIGGHGAEVLKGNYGWRRIHDITKGISNKAISSSVFSECSSGLNAIGIDSDDPWGSEWHYLAHRNAIHSGRFTMHTLHGVRPILQKGLVGLSYSKNNRLAAPKKGNLSIVNDFLACAAPNLALFPFEGNRIMPSFASVAEIANVAHERYGFDYRSTIPFCFDEYEIIGSPFSIRNGGPRCFVQKAIASGIFGPRYSRNIFDLVKRASSFVPIELRSFYNPFIDSIKKSVFDKTVLPPAEGTLAGKIMIFLMME